MFRRTLWTMTVCMTVIAAALSGCAQKVHRVAFDNARVVTHGNVPLACRYRLGDVVDARPETGRAGGLGKHLFEIDDATGLVRSKLQAIGIVPSTNGGERVDVRLVHFYLSQNTITKVPVLVLGVTVADSPSWLIRSQKASMNWNGTENEAYRAYAGMFDDAMAQLVTRLNARCAAKR